MLPDLFTVRQNSEPTLAIPWANLHVIKWPNIEKNNLPSGPSGWLAGKLL